MCDDVQTVRELSLSNGARCYIKTIEVSVTFATSDGSLGTLEGNVPYCAGDALMTGVQGERWPIERKKFDEWYRAINGKPGFYYKIKSVLAKKMERAFRVPITKDEQTFLIGKAGDWAVQTTPGNLSVVGSGIFEQTYQIAD